MREHGISQERVWLICQHCHLNTISQTILDLEEELGVKLLFRTKRTVQLTAAGSAFLQEAEQILNHAKEAAQIARRAAGGETGSLGVGFFGTASSPFLPSLVQSYRQKFPDVQLQLYEMTPDQQLAAFDDGRIDLGFSRKRQTAAQNLKKRTSTWTNSELRCLLLTDWHGKK